MFKRKSLILFLMCVLVTITLVGCKNKDEIERIETVKILNNDINIYVGKEQDELFTVAEKDSTLELKEETDTHLVVALTEEEVGYISKEEMKENNVDVEIHEEEIISEKEFEQLVEEQKEKSKDCEHEREFIGTLNEATCRETGMDLYKCKKCGLEEFIISDKLEHVISKHVVEEPTMDKAGKIEYKCDVCGKVIKTEDLFLPIMP